ncbi:MAG: helix-hairpin-helix domain-containing protein [Armatimonadota bacterium]
MSFDLASLVSPATFIGLALGSGLSALFDKGVNKRTNGEEFSSDGFAQIASLKAEIEANKESQVKVDEVHAYARKLEEKVQQLESTSDSADSQLRVKVLEKQLSDKADLESKLAVALQQLEDYKAKADMFDTVVGAEPSVNAKSEIITEPLSSVVSEEPELIAEAINSEPAHSFELQPEVAEVTEVAEVATIPTVSEPQPEPEVETIAAVASATEVEEAPHEMTVVENDNAFTGVASPAGSTAPAIEERPALRIESNPVIEIKDPLEKIEGIGQIYQTKLYEAGIKTFAQLAAASPSRITEVVEPQNWQTIDIMKWRREAALYAAGEKA